MTQVKLIEDKEDLFSFLKNNDGLYKGFSMDYPDEVVIEPEIVITVSLSDLYCFISTVQANLKMKATLNKSDWMDIETAPKDGSDILIKRGVVYRVVYWDSNADVDYHWHVNDSGKGFNHHDTFPTHWMPLPA